MNMNRYQYEYESIRMIIKVRNLFFENYFPIFPVMKLGLNFLYFRYFTSLIIPFDRNISTTILFFSKFLSNLHHVFFTHQRVNVDIFSGNGQIKRLMHWSTIRIDLALHHCRQR